MKLLIEVVQNNGPGQSYLVNIYRLRANSTLVIDPAPLLLNHTDAPDEKSAIWCALRILEDVITAFDEFGT